MDSVQRDQMARFEAALASNPRDEALHKVYADFLDECGMDSLAEHHRLWTHEWQDSYEWLEKFTKDDVNEYSDEWDPDVSPSSWDPFTGPRGRVTLDMVIDAANKYLETGEQFCLSGLGFGAENATYEPTGREQFWKHFCVYTRKEHVERMEEGAPFICGC